MPGQLLRQLATVHARWSENPQKQRSLVTCNNSWSKLIRVWDNRNNKAALNAVMSQCSISCLQVAYKVILLLKGTLEKMRLHWWKHCNNCKILWVALPDSTLFLVDPVTCQPTWKSPDSCLNTVYKTGALGASSASASGIARPDAPLNNKTRAPILSWHTVKGLLDLSS